MPGPLAGVKVLEIGGIGPNPFAGMLLADMGADIIRVDRPGPMSIPTGGAKDPSLRGRQILEADLKDPGDHALILGLAAQADVLIEGYRPGVLERLGLGPEALWEHNPRLVYGRITGFGQEGPYSQVAGHDINYISLSGALGASQRIGDKPMFALNLVGDYGGGAMFLVVGVLAALLEARESGRGQVVDAAMVDGSALLTTLMHGFASLGQWDLSRPGTNLLDSGAHFYEVYACSDGGHVAVGALEPQFYARLLELMEIPAEEMPQYDTARWPEFKATLAARFAQRTSAEWGELLEGEETCATVVRTMAEAPEHPHMAARETFVELDGVRQPAPAPRFSRTPSEARAGQEDLAGALARWGVEDPREG